MVSKSNTLKLNEVFYSIQGEGIYQGEPTIFIRLQGCNLECSFCDTTYASGGKPLRVLTPYSLVKELHNKYNLNHKHICITGGEPLLQDSTVYNLVTLLIIFNCKISIETNGSLIPPLQLMTPIVNSWVVDYKLPSSGSFKSFNFKWLNYLQPMDQLKFVASNKEDLKEVLVILKILYSSSIHPPKILISPTFKDGVLDTKLCDTCIEFCKETNSRFSLQIHKIIWGLKKGV